MSFAAAGCAAQPTAREVIERIRTNVNCEWRADTIDTFKAGNPDTKVRGVAVTLMATFEVLERAAASGRNLIITHEPTFYDHQDQAKAMEGDAILAAKRAFIEKHGLVVWRFHDHWHMHKPDGIDQGFIAKMGWQKYEKRVAGPVPYFELPPTTVGKLAADLKAKFNARSIRVVGDPAMSVTKAAFSAGAPATIGHMKALSGTPVEALVAGETREWETVEYVRDSARAAKPKALILLGHVISEEAGMENCANWLKGFVKDVPVEFIPAGEPFWSPE
jgi:putative NIF3 family GTP cyclohydrolase 1 type 2